MLFRSRNHHWYGNVRELKNLVQRLLILGAGDEISQEEVVVALGSVGGGHSELEQHVAFDQPLRQAREDFERSYLVYHLDQHGGNVTQMAKAVGMERTHLYRKLRSLGIEIKDRK